MEVKQEAKGHPTRAAILQLLSGEEMTPAELRRELPGEPSLSVTGYHLAILLRANLVACFGGVYRRLSDR
jgi:DNA-binding transcriptional ArsR family regulator